MNNIDNKLNGSFYLELMRKCLCNTIYGDDPIDPWSGGVYREDVRKLGRDWPSKAHSMIGELRMLNIQILIEHILENEIPGDFIETGVWRGGACIFMRAILKAHGDTNRSVWVADFFEGLPPPQPEYLADTGDKHHKYTQLAVSQEDVEANFRTYNLLDGQVKFLKGWFKDTLPEADIQKLALLRLDGDMYESTFTALTYLYPKLVSGGFVIVDDYGAVPGCRQAIEDYRHQYGITAMIHDIDGAGVYWQKQ